jgi:hypothetical protein
MQPAAPHLQDDGPRRHVVLLHERLRRQRAGGQPGQHVCRWQHAAHVHVRPAPALVQEERLQAGHGGRRQRGALQRPCVHARAAHHLQGRLAPVRLRARARGQGQLAARIGLTDQGRTARSSAAVWLRGSAGEQGSRRGLGSRGAGPSRAAVRSRCAGAGARAPHLEHQRSLEASQRQRLPQRLLARPHSQHLAHGRGPGQAAGVKPREDVGHDAVGQPRQRAQRLGERRVLRPLHRLELAGAPRGGGCPRDRWREADASGPAPRARSAAGGCAEANNRVVMVGQHAGGQHAASCKAAQLCEF